MIGCLCTEAGGRELVSSSAAASAFCNCGTGARAHGRSSRNSHLNRLVAGCDVRARCWLPVEVDV
jgi:hypothetical protein